MFSKKVIDTDNFIEMPSSARLLYYDLNMRADDDGFVSNPKKIIKFVGASDDDFKILCAKRYIIPFETGICVIRHWRIHNFIRHDRYEETEYINEKNSLTVINRKYENVIPNGNQMSYQMATQVRLGKDRIDKDRINKDIPPILEDIKQWNIDNNIGLTDFQIEYAFNHYASKDWMIGKNKMKDWRRAFMNVRTWDISEKKTKMFSQRNAFIENLSSEQQKVLAERDAKIFKINQKAIE